MASEGSWRSGRQPGARRLGRGQCCGQWQGQGGGEMGVWLVAWLGVGSARPNFLFGSHFLFSLWGMGEGDLHVDQENKGEGSECYNTASRVASGVVAWHWVSQLTGVLSTTRTECRARSNPNHSLVCGPRNQKEPKTTNKTNE